MTCWCEGKCPHIAAPTKAFKAGRSGQAMAMLRNALSAAPFCVEANLSIAATLAFNNRALEAETHIERAARYGAPARIAIERANVKRQQMRLVEAMPLYLDAMGLNPDNARVFAAAAGTIEMVGDLKSAAALAETAHQRFPDSVDLRRVAANIKAEAGDFQGAADMLSVPDLTPMEHLDRGRALEKLGDYAGAWEEWMTGKAMTRDTLGHKYQPEVFASHFAALRTAATPPRPNFYRAAPASDAKPKPIFVCGFPRSGTTLMETLLSNHSQIVAGDELMGLNDVIEAMPAWLKVRAPYPAALMATGLGENALMPELLRDLYIRTARQHVRWPAKKERGMKPFYFTDKMPLNEIHLPLIGLLFGNAMVIRMERHPLDVMVSCMSQWMAHGGFFASSLESCAAHYKAADDLVQFYKAEVAAGRLRSFLSIKYEGLIADPAGRMADIFAGLGLELEPRCLHPNKNGRHARTLSYSAVKKPITDKSIGRWKNFRDHLAPAVEILRPIMEREGYDF